MYLDVLYEAQREFARHAPEQMAALGGGFYDAARRLISLRYLNETYRITFPEGELLEAEQPTPLTSDEHALVLQYLVQARGLPLTGRWISFAELPNGMLHDLPFRVDVLRPLAATFGGQPGKLLDVAASLGGTRLSIGDVGVVIPVLPRIAVAVCLWVGDDEFPARANLVFDAVAPSYLATATLYVMGVSVARRLRTMAG